MRPRYPVIDKPAPYVAGTSAFLSRWGEPAILDRCVIGDRPVVVPMSQARRQLLRASVTAAQGAAGVLVRVLP